MAKKTKKNTKPEEVEELSNDAQSEQNEESNQEQEVEQERDIEEELKQANDKFLRLYAEFENYKKRTVKEKLELMKNAAQNTMTKLVPVLDDFDRAKLSAEDESTTEQLSEGVLMVYNKLYSVLNGIGLNEMTTTGEMFDPELHEAISEIPAASEDQKGVIIDTVAKGYYLNDKIIRHAKVVVGK